MGARDAVITGIGLVSCLGEGPDAHWDALSRGGPFPVQTEGFAPYAVHPLVKLDLDRQIPKRGDQRQMEAWQRIGTYAAGLALEQAGVKGNADLLARTDMIVAATGGERDTAVDASILATLPKAANPGAFLNEKLMADLRPTLFLAQLSNLLAGNISIVHGVVGSSRSFLGEEGAGGDAVRVACARIEAGQSELALVGGACNAERPDLLLTDAMGGVGMLWHGDGAPPPVWARQDQGGGMVLGSVGAFLVIESRAHAEARGAHILARIAGVQTDRCRREPGQATENARRQLDRLMALGRPDGVISAATGAAPGTAEEAAFLRSLGLPYRAVATALGSSLEASFFAAAAIAAIALTHGALPPPAELAEPAYAGPLRQVLVTGWGHWRSEAMALVAAE
ncbi:MAG TPA: beta-ketoacyl-ACP synthase [Acidisphaera sp.]|nr:beta-ketoacyl-ACP synthase [Acidisphaera sp.]